MLDDLVCVPMIVPEQCVRDVALSVVTGDYDKLLALSIVR